MTDSPSEVAPSADETDSPASTELLQVGTSVHKGKSIRVNLSVPFHVNQVLSGLAAKTGSSKASFVMQALRWYLPDLRVKLAEFDEVQAHIKRRQRLAANGSAVEVSYERKLPREERRKLERERLKAAKKQRL